MEKYRKLQNLITGLLRYDLVLVVNNGISEIDALNDKFPHKYDSISPLIENHVGNMPKSMVISIIAMGCVELAKNVIDKKTKNKKAAKLIDKLYRAAPILIIGAVGALNAYVETGIPGNYEMMGDIASGTIGSGLAVGLLCLPGLIAKKK